MTAKHGEGRKVHKKPPQGKASVKRLNVAKRKQESMTPVREVWIMKLLKPEYISVFIKQNDSDMGAQENKKSKKSR